MKAIFAFALCLMLITCFGQKLKQGIHGQVYWISGNHMPGPGARMSPQLGVSRELHVYALTHLKDCQQDGVFFHAISTPLIMTVHSLPDGTFKIKLPPGTYSVFVKEPNGLFANLFGQHGAINPVIVKEKEYSWLAIAIDYEAAY